MIKYILSAIGIFLSITSFSQEFKYGKVSKELLLLNQCNLDKNADAMVTFKSGEQSMLYSNINGFRSFLNEKKQIKIFNNEAKDIGTVRIIFYSPKDNKNYAKVENIKGKTYNIVDNKIIETKIEKENIFTEQYNNYTKIVTIAIPQIAKNCVFEYEYDLVSEHYSNIKDWKIQENYPVLYNHFIASFPDFFNYQVSVVGGLAPSKVENYNTNQYIALRQGSDVEQYNLNIKNQKYVFENIKASVDEPFVANPDDNLSKINFQLISVHFPDSPVQEIAGDYSKITKRLLELESFGDKIKNGKYIEEVVSLNKDDSIINSALFIYDYFIKNIKWDGNFDFVSDKKLKELIKNGKGDVAEINLNYISALNHAGVVTYPVILSSRGNGTLHPIYADYSHFDYVVALSVIDGKDYLSDATSGLPFGSLPTRCLNGSGWLVNDTGQSWISLKNSYSGKQVVQNEIELNNGKIIYQAKKLRSGHFAFDDFILLNKSNTSDFLKLGQDQEGLTLDSLILLERNQNSLKIMYQYHVEMNDDIIYINPFIQHDFLVNPFKQEERVNIIDFPYAREYKLITIITIPKGYTFEVPVNFSSSLFENHINFKYLSQYNAGLSKLSVISDIKIKNTDYLVEDYQDLKKMFDSIVDKLKEPVVLKKL